MWDWNWCDIPDLTAVLGNCSIRRELTRLGDTDNSHFGPLVIVSVCFVTLFLGINVRVEIEACDVVVTAISQVFKDWMDDLSVTEESR